MRIVCYIPSIVLLGIASYHFYEVFRSFESVPFDLFATVQKTIETQTSRIRRDYGSEYDCIDDCFCRDDSEEAIIEKWRWEWWRFRGGTMVVTKQYQNASRFRQKLANCVRHILDGVLVTMVIAILGDIIFTIFVIAI